MVDLAQPSLAWPFPQAKHRQRPLPMSSLDPPRNPRFQAAFPEGSRIPSRMRIPGNIRVPGRDQGSCWDQRSDPGKHGSPVRSRVPSGILDSARDACAPESRHGSLIPPGSPDPVTARGSFPGPRSDMGSQTRPGMPPHAAWNPGFRGVSRLDMGRPHCPCLACGHDQDKGWLC